MDGFTEKQIEHFKTCFQLFDKGQSGTLPVTEVGQVMRAVGLNPSKEQIEEIINSVTQRTSTIDFEEFCSILEQNWVSDDAQNELRDAFGVFDREGSGYMTVEQFKSMLSSLGEKLTEDELKEIMKDCTVNGDGTINYDVFIKNITVQLP